MVEKAYSKKLNKNISENEFIKEFKCGKLPINTELNCMDGNCNVELEPYGKNKIQNGKDPKHKGFIIKNRNNPHLPACIYVSNSNFNKGIKNSVSYIKSLSNTSAITLIAGPKKQSKSQQSFNNINSNIVSTNKNVKNYSKKHMGFLNNSINISNLGTLVELFKDKSVPNNKTIKTSLNLPNVRGTSCDRILSNNDLFFDLDSNKKVPQNHFFIFYGKATFSNFSSDGLLINFKNETIKVPTNKKSLGRSIVGKKILKSQATNNHPVIYFEGYFDVNNKAKKVGSTFANCLYTV